MEPQRLHDEESARNYKELKNKLEQTLAKISKSIDLRESKALLIEVQNCFKGLKLLREDREELYTRLQNAFSDLNHKINEERLNFENEAALNYFSIKSKIEEAEKMLEDSVSKRILWDFLIEVQGMFKGVKLQREHRENLYGRLQKAFAIVKDMQTIERQLEEVESSREYENLKEDVDAAYNFALNCQDTQASKDILIKVQSLIRDANLVRTHKEELYAKIQEGFVTIQQRKDEEISKLSSLSDIQYDELNPEVSGLLTASEESTDFKMLREQLKELQSKVRESVIQREQRVELQEKLQSVFENINERQDSDRSAFQKEASENYKRLKALVNKGLTQAEETHEYKDTREFLKKIQSEFKGIKMIKEEREELYNRLQLAFETLNTRVDEYFRFKKKNWEVKMRYKLAEIETEIHQLHKDIEREQENLTELEEHLEILDMSGKDSATRVGVEARIITSRKTIEQKYAEIEQFTEEMEELRNRIDPEEDEQ